MISSRGLLFNSVALTAFSLGQCPPDIICILMRPNPFSATCSFCTLLATPFFHLLVEEQVLDLRACTSQSPNSPPLRGCTYQLFMSSRSHCAKNLRCPQFSLFLKLMVLLNWIVPPPKFMHAQNFGMWIYFEMGSLQMQWIKMRSHQISIGLNPTSSVL